MTVEKNLGALMVRDLMSTPVHTVPPTERLADVHGLMRLAGIRHLPVVDDGGVLLGVISDRDVNLAWSQGPDTPVRAFMTRNLQWVGPETRAREAAARMLQDRIGCLPVVDRQRRLLGIVTETDFLLVAHRALTVQLMVAGAW
jgi:CBS domain-containing membrane protein